MQIELRVRFHELDPNGHVNHGVYLNWFETARIEAMDELGFGLQTLRARGIHLVVTEANVRFRRPAVAGDVVTIESRVRDLRRATSWWHQRALRDGEVIAEVDVRSGSVDADGRPVAAPGDVLAALRGLQPVEQDVERGSEQDVERGSEQDVERGSEQDVERGIAAVT